MLRKFIKWDFTSVRSTHRIKGKQLPMWVSVIIYILLAPLGFVLLPFTLLAIRIKCGKEFYKQYMMAIKITIEKA